jgi:bifunctional non-homologous end joining protein LigD
MPGFIKPQPATKSRAPKGEVWLHEIKHDGYRVQVHLNRGRKKVFTRNGLDWTKRFTDIAGALAILAGRAGWSTTPSISSGGMATFASCRS